MRAFSLGILSIILTFPAPAQKFGPAENLGPNIPTPQSIVDRMLEAANVKPGEVVYDLGSGDGRIVITAAQKYGAKAVGIEILPDLVEQSRERVKALGLDEKVSIVQNSALRVDLSAADVVTMYFLTTSNDRLRPVLEHWLKPGARVVSNDFPVKGWKTSNQVHVKAGAMDHTLYVYLIGKTK